jgi:hypothetical protein
MFLTTVVSTVDVAATPQASGTFVGSVVAQWIDGGDNRNMVLVEDFAFRDSAGKLWEVPTGSGVNGASIPSVLWSLLGSPFTGPYRRAAVIHDHFCGIKTEPWRAVHRMFYNAMIAGGVRRTQAMVMYGAVYVRGPRWLLDDALDYVPRDMTQDDVRDLEDWIRRENPTLAELEKHLDS